MIHYVSKIILLGLVCGLAGWLALGLAVPPDIASPIWPPTGIGLAALLLWGNRFWPGVWLGSFLVHFRLTFETFPTFEDLPLLVLPLVISIGPALQASVGAYLVRRFVGFPTPLHNERQIGLFFGLGGGVSCLLSAIWGVSCLLTAGIFSWDQALWNGWNWWIGDVLGVVIFSPLVLVLNGKPRVDWVHRRGVVGGLLLLSFTLTVCAFFMAQQWSQDRIKLKFVDQARTVAETLTQRLALYEQIMYSIERFYASSAEVSREEFQTFVDKTFLSYPGVQALSWIPRVSEAKRSLYEQRMQEEGLPTVEFNERNEQGKYIRAISRPEYFPVFFISPMTGNEKAVGFNLASNPTRLAALEKARDSGQAVTTGRITLVQETGKQFGFLMFVPIYDKLTTPSTPQSHHVHLTGFASGVFRIGDLIQASLPNITKKELEFSLYDKEAVVKEQLLYTTLSTQSNMRHLASNELEDNSTPYSWTTTIQAADRTWALHFTATAEFLSEHQGWEIWGVLAGGLLFTALLELLLLTTTGRTRIVQQEVKERTASLEQANDRLNREISERTLIEQAMQESEEKVLQTARELEHQNLELALARDEALEAALAKSQFLATMSHEIRTPMNGVIGMADLLNSMDLTDEQDDCVQTIRGSGEALLAVINDILDFSKIEAGKLSIEHLPFNLRTVMEEVLELLKDQAATKHLDLIGFIPPDTPTALQGDPGRIRQVLLNLIGNSLKFTEQGEVILHITSTTTTTSHVSLRIEVRDSGVGITEEVKKKLFQPFSQADSSTTRKFGGTGLGLAICKELVNMMSGDIGIDSLSPQGSCFWLTLQLERQSDTEEPNDTSSALQGLRVCIVDSHPFHRDMLEQYTQSIGMIPSGFSDSPTMLSHLQETSGQSRPFSLVVLTQYASDSENERCIEFIHAAQTLANIPVLLITPLRCGNIMEQNTSMPSTNTTKKPVRLKRLSQAISDAASIQQESEPQEHFPDSEESCSSAITDHERRIHHRILLVEDNMVNQKVAMKMLQTLGYAVDVATNGHEALQALQHSLYSLIFMDCHMPVMDGYEATRAIRAREEEQGVSSKELGETGPASPASLHLSSHSRIPIIALTANALKGDREQCLECGMDDFLSKPMKMGELEATLVRWLPQPENQRLSTSPSS